eukprot:3412156-Amphidinium_carterae.1
MAGAGNLALAGGRSANLSSISAPSCSTLLAEGSSPASKLSCILFLASSTAMPSTPISSPGFCSGLGGSPLTSSMSSSSLSRVGCIDVGSVSWARNAVSVPCSVARGLPRPGLAARPVSRCPVTKAGVAVSARGSRGGVCGVAGTPGASVLAVAFLSWSTFSAKALAVASPHSLAHSNNCSNAEEEA